jgi:type IV secretion system protein VirD4
MISIGNNKIQKVKSNISLFEIIIAIIILLLDCISVYQYSFVVTQKNFNQKDIFKIVEQVSQNIQKEPLNIDLNNKKVIDKFIDTQEKLAIVYIIVLLLFLTRSKNEWKGIEHGSAGWANGKEKEPFRKMQDKKLKINNIVLSNELFLPLDTRVLNRNLNRLLIGGSGTGKSRFFVKPSLMQTNTSFVVTDPKGECYRDTAYFLQKQGYKIKVLNLVEPKYSMRYNPFAYLKEDKDVLILVDTLIKNTTGKKAGGDEFWVKSETALLQALVYYLWKERPVEEQNFASVLAMATSAKVAEEEENQKENPLEEIFANLEDKEPEHIAVKCYNVFKLAGGKTAKSILISLAVRLAMFNTQEIVNLTCKEELQLDEVGERKTAVFIIIPDTHKTFNVIAAMFYSQLFQSLVHKADFEYGGRLPIHVQCLLDEFANIGEIPEFDKLIATIRSREISVAVVVQALSQLKTMYKDSWETIVACCDSLIFLGTSEQTTLEYVAKKLGKTTVQIDTKGFSKGKGSSRSENMNFAARDLMAPDELGRMDNQDSIVIIRGFKPFFTKKFKIERHPNYKYLEGNPSDYRLVEVKKTIPCIFNIPKFVEELEEQRQEKIQLLKKKLKEIEELEELEKEQSE